MTKNALKYRSSTEEGFSGLEQKVLRFTATVNMARIAPEMQALHERIFELEQQLDSAVHAVEQAKLAGDQKIRVVLWLFCTVISGIILIFYLAYAYA